MCPKLSYILLWPKFNGCIIFPLGITTQLNCSNTGWNLEGFPFFIINDDWINFLMHKSLSDPLLLYERFRTVKLLEGRKTFFIYLEKYYHNVSLHFCQFYIAFNYIIMLSLTLYLYQYWILSSSSMIWKRVIYF